MVKKQTVARIRIELISDVFQTPAVTDLATLPLNVIVSRDEPVLVGFDGVGVMLS